MYHFNIPFKFVNPSTFKKLFTGDGRAQKEDIQRLIKTKYDLEFDDDNQADAFGLAQLFNQGKLNKIRGVNDFVARKEEVYQSP